MSYCTFETRRGMQVCTVCGASFSATGKVMAVCGVERPKGPPPPGVGTQLKKLLSRIGIKPTPTCKCASKANVMDRKGVDWCEQNIETIVEWMREEAEKRKLPYLNTVGRMLVRRAINNARKEADRATQVRVQD